MGIDIVTAPPSPIPVQRPFQTMVVDVMDLPVTDSGNRHVVQNGLLYFLCQIRKQLDLLSYLQKRSSHCLEYQKLSFQIEVQT